jgi:hypothetical protein
VTGSTNSPDPLGLDAAEMRRLGYWVVDRVVAHFEGVADEPAIRTGTPAELRAALGGPPPEKGADPLRALEILADVALAHMQHGDHPRNFARVPGPSSYAGVLGEWLGTGFNAIAASWAGGSGPAMVELVTLDWLRSLLGMPEGTEGVMTSGGSLANLTALAAARANDGAGVCYLSGETHASIVRGLPALGFAAEHVRVIPADDDMRLPLAALTAAVGEDKAAGRRPGFVVASPGSPTSAAPRGCGCTSTAPTAPPPLSVRPGGALWRGSSAPTRSSSTRTSGSSSPTTSAACSSAGPGRSGAPSTCRPTTSPT